MFVLTHLKRLCGLFLVLWTFDALAQIYNPGTVYFGRSNYIEYTTGDLPFIMSAPHGGTLNPLELPDRTNCPTCSGWDFTTTTDTATDDVARKVLAQIGTLTGHLPHIIICNLDRGKIDCNRAIAEGAQANTNTIQAWNEFQGWIKYASNNIVTNFGKGFYIDQHGQGHPEQRLELGYLLDKYDLTNTDAYMDSHPATFKNPSSIRTLANSVSNTTPFSKLLRGTNSFGAFMADEGYAATPSDVTPAPYATPVTTNNFFDGGYNTSTHGSDGGGPLSALQIEANMVGVRDSSANRTAYAAAVARTLEKYFTLYYGINLRSCTPTFWNFGTGNWSVATNWALKIVPVNTNWIVFGGPGGTATHNLTAFTNLTALAFGNAASGAYTLSGNAFNVLGGVTNANAFTNTINNNIALPANSPFAINSGALAVNGILSGSGGLTKSGSGTLALTALNTYSGPTTNLSGAISLNATSTVGSGTNLLVLAGGDLLSLNTRSTAPISNILVMTADTTISGNATLTNSTRILPFSANSISTPGGTLTIRHTGTNATATNNVFRVRFTGGGFNVTRPIVVGHAADLPATISQLESFNDSAVGDEMFSGNISGTGQFRRDATSPVTAGRTILSGSNTYSGGTFVLAGTLLVNNTSGSGTGSGVVIVSNNATLGGGGTLAGAVNCAGTLTPSGTLTFGGGLDLSLGGTNVWELSAHSENSAGTNFDQLVLTGGSLVLAGNSRLQIAYTNSAFAPTNTSPFWLMSHVWKIISLNGTATNPGVTKFPQIVNATYATGSFTNYTDAAGNVYLAYLALPAAKPLVQSFQFNAAGALVMSVSAETNRTYVLQSATNLIDPVWLFEQTNTAVSSVLNVTNILDGVPAKFFRLLVVP